MLEGAGFEEQDLGIDVAPELFVEPVRAGGVDLVSLLALLTTMMMNMSTTIQALNESGLHARTRIMVGGAPVIQVFADKICADGYAPDASCAVVLAHSLMGI